MLAFDTPSHRFQLRSAAIVQKDDAVLLHRAESDTFWALPGGRLEPGETSAATLEREFEEELGVELRVGSLALVVENFFAYAGQQYHEIGLYFLARLAPACRLMAETGPYPGREGARYLTFDWFPRRALADLDLRPACLARLLIEPLAGVRHVVHRDRESPRPAVGSC